MYEWHLEGDTDRFVHEFKGFSKDEEYVKVNKAVARMANNFNLGVGEDDSELLDVVPAEMTNEVLELKQEHTAEEEAREEKTVEEKEELPRKFTVKI